MPKLCRRKVNKLKCIGVIEQKTGWLVSLCLWCIGGPLLSLQHLTRNISQFEMDRLKWTVTDKMLSVTEHNSSASGCAFNGIHILTTLEEVWEGVIQSKAVVNMLKYQKQFGYFFANDALK